MQGVVHVLFVSAAVVDHPDCIAVWHCLRPDQIAPAQRDTIDTEPSGGNVDQPFDRESDFRTSGAAIGLRWDGVGKNGHGLQRGHRNVIASGDQAGAFAQRRKRNTSGADIADVGCAQRQKPAPLIECQLKLRHQVAALVVADETVRTCRGVFDRTSELAGGPQHEPEFNIDAIARAEIAADVIGEHADFVGLDPEHCSELAFLPDGPAAAGVNRVAVSGLVVVRNRGARLHRHACYPADVEIFGDDVRGTLESAPRLGRVAEPGVDQDVVRNFVPDCR